MAPAAVVGIGGAGGALLRPGEEAWREVFERLCDRFPDFAHERIAQVLRDEKGHAGQASAVLRDLGGKEMRPVDPDDAEHVRTILSSPALFKHTCAEQFRKFDINGDGSLDLAEIVSLVNALYENFGLQAPREAALRAFFKETDANDDGVLSEKEFKRFFEHFLNYAFFDIKSQEVQAQYLPQEVGPGSSHSEGRAPKEPRPGSSHSEARANKEPRPGSSHSEARANKESKSGAPRDRESRSRRSTPPAEDPAQQQQQQQQQRADRAGERQAGAMAQAFRCVALTGVAHRKSPDAGSRTDAIVQRGEVVQALEHWIRTAHGWLPVAVESGELLFEPCAAGAGEPAAKASRAPAMAEAPAAPEDADRRASPLSQKVRFTEGSSGKRSSSRTGADGETGRKREKERPSAEAGGGGRGGGGLRPGEEEWRELFNRLSERFPAVSPEDVAQALREQGGHAGQAATRLRELSRASGG